MKSLDEVIKKIEKQWICPSSDEADEYCELYDVRDDALHYLKEYCDDRENFSEAISKCGKALNKYIMDIHTLAQQKETHKMKKRIGTKIYDTATSEMIAYVGVGILYRKRTRKREWFLLIGDNIEPLDDKQARALLGENVYHEPEPESKRVMIGVDRTTHSRLAAAAKRDAVSITEIVRRLAAGL